ncbi:MAG: DedA family protein [Holosporaceae bacterium]|nr:DedA family protein [Holosporaceae bacterium]
MLENFIQNYGYYAVFLCACIEGEIAILTAGFLCQHGMMSLPLVMLTAFLGTLMTEQGLFFMGRIYGTKLLNEYPKLSAKVEKVMVFLRKYDSAFIFGSRFVYGIRNISPIVIGMAGILPLKFSTLNIPAALLWSVLVAGAGYLFADMLELAKGHMKLVQYVALAVLVITFGYFIYRKSKGNRRKEDKSGRE